MIIQYFYLKNAPQSGGNILQLPINFRGHYSAIANSNYEDSAGWAAGECHPYSKTQIKWTTYKAGLSLWFIAIGY